MLGMRTGVCAVILATLGVSSPAAAQPAWCNVPDAVDPRGPNLEKALTGQDPIFAVEDLVALTCKPDDEARARMREIDAARKRWSGVLDMTEADWQDARVWAGQDQSTRASHTFRIDDRGTRDGVAGPARIAWSALTALDQFSAMFDGLGNDSETDSKDASYLADALGPKLTEVGRLGYLLSTCAKEDPNPVVLAMCAGDVAALDRKQLGRELRADRSYTGTERMLVRLALLRYDQWLPTYRAEVKKWSAKDEAYAKMFELAAQQRTEWTQRTKAEAELLALVAQMEDARATGSRKAIKGCEDRTWPALQAAISTIPAAAFTDLPDEPANPFASRAAAVIIGAPRGYLAAVAYHHCHERADDHLAGLLGSAMQRWPGHRGPRTATATAILLAGLELDDARAKIQHPTWMRRTLGAHGGTLYAKLAKQQRDGDKVTLSWESKKVKVWACQRRSQTPRVTQILPNGELVYHQPCLEMKEVDAIRTPEPTTVRARYLEGVKPGVMLRTGGDVVVAAYQKGAKAPSRIMGAPVK